MKTLNQINNSGIGQFYRSLVGKEVYVCVNEDIVKGKAIEFTEDDNTWLVRVEHKPVVCGNKVITSTLTKASKKDNMGSLRNVKPVLFIQNQAIC